MELAQVTKRFGADVLAVDDLSLTLEHGEFLALLGPSGCGKSTTLRLIAGLESPDLGSIHLQGRRVAGKREWVPPEQRHMGMVFQDYALFPHLTIGENIGFPLGPGGTKTPRTRVDELLDTVGMTGLAERYPHQLSGGQQQRAALARALAADPAVILLDEPFSNLDASLRESMRGEMRSIISRTGITTVLVTHDQQEALSMADTVAVMFSGQIAHIGPPEEIYFRPESRRIAAFVGSARFIPGHARGSVVECALGTLPLARDKHGDVEVLLRPDSLVLHAEENGRSRIISSRFFGPYRTAGVRLPDGSVVEVRTAAHDAIPPRSPVTVQPLGPVTAYAAS